MKTPVLTEPLKWKNGVWAGAIRVAARPVRFIVDTNGETVSGAEALALVASALQAAMQNEQALRRAALLEIAKAAGETASGAEAQLYLDEVEAAAMALRLCALVLVVGAGGQFEYEDGEKAFYGAARIIARFDSHGSFEEAELSA
jgi:hypothetical protein